MCFWSAWTGNSRATEKKVGASSDWRSTQRHSSHGPPCWSAIPASHKAPHEGRSPCVSRWSSQSKRLLQICTHFSLTDWAKSHLRNSRHCVLATTACKAAERGDHHGVKYVLCTWILVDLGKSSYQQNCCIFLSCADQVAPRSWDFRMNLRLHWHWHWHKGHVGDTLYQRWGYMHRIGDCYACTAVWMLSHQLLDNCRIFSLTAPFWWNSMCCIYRLYLPIVDLPGCMLIYPL